jgi:molybdopterin-guanine dinucleotide biosynthesis protein A
VANETSEEIFKPHVPLYGLVLAGGRSVRMGQDKGAMTWHGKEQRYFMADMLQTFCDSVYISCRPDQLSDIDASYHAIVDNVDGAGPIVAILSAFQQFPAVAWLVVACDLPLLSNVSLLQLTSGRELAAMATTFSSPFDGLPEPLITIWEPDAYPFLQSHFSEGFKCPRKALIRNAEKVRLLTPVSPHELLNTNTPEDTKIVYGHLYNNI